MKKNWVDVTPYLSDPVNVMSPYWQNNTCSPFPPYAESDGGGSCKLGNLAPYAVNVSSAADAIAGIKFAQDHNIRLTIKNTGHDYLGRSAGASSLALWTHNLQAIDFVNYTSTNYTGPAVRVGAGVESSTLTAAANLRGLVVVGGSCPSVGIVGGWAQGAGHGPLTAAYGLGADNVLEFEVVTAGGQHLNATPSNPYSDLYWALSGGGGGNYAVVLSATFKAYPDKPVAGASFSFANTDPENFWAAVRKWFERLLVLNEMPGLKTIGSITATGFALDFATWPGATAGDLVSALMPFWNELEALNVSLTSNVTAVSPTYLQHFQHFTTTAYTVNETVAGRLIPRLLVGNATALATYASIIRNMTSRGASFNIIASNLSRSSAPAPNSVLPAWRESLFHMNFALSLLENAPWANLSAQQTLSNSFQAQFRDLTPGSGSYINEASVTDAMWKADYFGVNYARLLRVKQKYDPHSIFWAPVAVGSDESWTPAANGTLCRVAKNSHY